MRCDSPRFVIPKARVQAVPVPCGRCPPCKTRRVNSWVFRLLQEQTVSTSAHFVTLTYDTRTVPISDNGFLTLRKRDYQLYMKRLRKLCPEHTLKYYAVGEYGTLNERPHYHAIIFNCPTDHLFADAWGLGQVHVGRVTSDSIAYCMKYIDKPPTAKKHLRDDRVREFSLMSSKLGACYMSDDMVAYHRADLSRVYVTKPGGYRIAMPRYYREKIFTKLQLDAQIDIITAAVEEQEKLSRLRFDQFKYDPSYTYEEHQVRAKHGRYHSFYSRQTIKPRLL